MSEVTRQAPIVNTQTGHPVMAFSSYLRQLERRLSDAEGKNADLERRVAELEEGNG